ncbi:MAG TPA: glycosyltransferase [Candidatus Binatia bacterium]|nr:glycosyltransferase [Candidatus Binatia bacterium]
MARSLPEQVPPPEVEAAARERSAARSARDWATADRLRGEIEAAGWKVVDAGTAYRLEPAHPPDVEVEGEIRYGRSDAVPSRLHEPATGLACVVVVASPDRATTEAALAGLRAGARAGTDVVVVADGLPDEAVDGLAGAAGAGWPTELIRTSAPLGHAAALNAGIRRARAEVVVVLDPSIVLTGDVVGPLVEALADATVAIAGPFGLRSSNLRQFEEALEGDAVAIQGYLQAFRRSDYVARGPLDEGFRFYRNLDIWWSLVLRDEGEGEPPRRAVVVPGLPLERGEPAAWMATPEAVRDRLSKRNFYRILDRFRTRLDLAG